LSAEPSGRAYLRLVALGALVGVPAALVAALFLAAVHGLEDWLWSDPRWYLVLGLPVVGACVVLAARTLWRRSRWCGSTSRQRSPSPWARPRAWPR
jgi:H+/Cl- antiporter ClcA